MDPRRQGILRGLALVSALLGSSTLGAQLVSDNFDSYSAGTWIHGQGEWEVWDGAGLPPAPGYASPVAVNDAQVVPDVAGPSGDNVLQLQPADDIVRVFGGLNTGSFSFTSSVYIPPAQAGNYYYLILNRYVSGGAKNWSAQIHFNTATSQVTADNVTVAGVGSYAGGLLPAAAIVYNTWVEVDVVVDFGATWTGTGGATGTGTYDAFYNGVQVVDNAAWFGAGGQLEMEAIDLYNDGGGVFYYDNVQVDCLANCGCLPFDQVDCSIDCSTNDVSIDWTTFQTTGYAGGIVLQRDAVTIATFPNGTTSGSYLDPNVPLGSHTYTLIGDCTGGQTTSASCSLACTGGPCPPIVPGDECCGALPAALGPNPFDTTLMTASPDSYSEVGQCAGTFLGDMVQDVWFTYTAAGNGYIRVDTCTVGGSFTDTDLVIYEGANCGTKVQIACNGDSCGLSSDVTFASTAGQTYVMRIGGWNASAFGTGTMVLSELCDPDLTGFAGVVDCDTGDVTLTWDSGTFDGYELFRDGLSVATLPAGTVSYVDSGLVADTYDYELIGSCTAQGTSLNATISVTVAGSAGATDIILRRETAGGLVDSVAALQAALAAQPGVTVVVLDLPPEGVPCVADPGLERVWVCIGSFPNDQTLTPASEAAMVTIQGLGKHVYIESGDEWGFNGVTVLGDIDGIAPGALDGNDSFLSMTGANSGVGLDLSTYLAVPYTQDNAGNDWTDQVQASATDLLGTATGVIWTEAGGTYNTGVYYDTNAGGKVLCQTWEFGGFGGDQNALAGAYIAALGGGGPVVPQFRRGDCNSDGLFNIADPITTLGFLFPSGPPPTLNCIDACDANDDGLLNIADPISKLGALFPAGPPTPLPAPFPGCGQDPTTADPFGCVLYPSCP